MSFSDEMRAFAKKTGGKLEDVARDVVLSVGRKVVEMSPVGLRERWQVNIIRAAKGLPLTPKGYVGGHFRVNWQHGFGAPAIGEIDGTDNAGSATSILQPGRGQGGLPVIEVHDVWPPVERWVG